ncbi:MAG TPA: DNA repair protein RecO [Terriglobales bacterium]|nr:DNA repair protein RecO [Terriglobales bacterium]
MLKQSDAIVLRTYPFREADLLVTLFTREEGKLKGVARSAKKSKRRFGGALEPLTRVRAYYDHKEGQELVRLDSCDVIESPLMHAIDYERAIALSYVAEVLDSLLPDHETNDAVFRLTLSVLPYLEAGHLWMPLTYFDLWIARLMGLLPELGECIVCGESLNGTGKAYFHALADGLMCLTHKRLASSEMSLDSRKIASEMFRAPIDAFASEPWKRQRGADLRKFAGQCIERHTEGKLVTALALAKLN